MQIVLKFSKTDTLFGPKVSNSNIIISQNEVYVKSLYIT